MRLGYASIFLLFGGAISVLAQAPARPVIAQTGTTTPSFTVQNSEPAPKLNPKVYPISLAAALKLAGAKPLDIQIADEQVNLASRQLERANLLWVPNIVMGTDYFRHEGGQQNFAGEILRSSRGSFSVGAGPNLVVSISDALFAPLAAKQDLQVRRAYRQAVENDIGLSVVEAYFRVQQSRGELAGAIVAIEKAEEVARKAEKLADGLAPPLEANRAKVELARRQQIAATARESWRIASAELARLLRLEAGTLIEPVEAPYLPITIIDPRASVETLIPIALQNRPELAGQQALVQATLTRLKQEKLRPLIPSLALRSTSTNPSGSIAWGGFGGGQGGSLNSFGSRFDLDLQVLWEFQSLGLGNKARVGEKKSEHMIAMLEFFRAQDRIAAEVDTAHAQIESARERLSKAEPALRSAVELVEKSLQGMGQTKRVGESNVLIVRPLEVVSAVQSFGQANADFYSAVGDYNRAQFRLYRALGNCAGDVSKLLPENAAPAPQSVPQNLSSAEPPPPVLPVSYSEPVRTSYRDLAIAREMLNRKGSVEVAASIPTPLQQPIPATQSETVWQKAEEMKKPMEVKEVIPTPAKPQTESLEWGRSSK